MGQGLCGLGRYPSSLTDLEWDGGRLVIAEAKPRTPAVKVLPWRWVVERTFGWLLQFPFSATLGEPSAHC
jgi:hypothetical protein